MPYFHEGLSSDSDAGRITDAVYSVWESPASGGNWSTYDSFGI